MHSRGGWRSGCSASVASRTPQTDGPLAIPDRASGLGFLLVPRAGRDRNSTCTGGGRSRRVARGRASRSSGDASRYDDDHSNPLAVTQNLVRRNRSVAWHQEVCVRGQSKGLQQIETLGRGTEFDGLFPAARKNFRGYTAWAIVND